MKILLLNGAPRSGKDTVSIMLKTLSASSVHQEKFALPIKLAAPLIYGVGRDRWENEFDTPRNKDLACEEFFGKTPREVQIAMSEDLLKPLHGKEIFGELLSRRIKSVQQRGMLECAVVSDSGFYHEAKEIIDTFGADNVQLWRILREGCDFSRDSRTHVDLVDDGVDCYDIPNNGSLDDLRALIEPLYKAFVLPRENRAPKDGEPETDEEWKIRRREAAKEAFLRWPERKIENIRNQNNDTQS
jgi:hypothetical protein